MIRRCLRPSNSGIAVMELCPSNSSNIFVMTKATCIVLLNGFVLRGNRWPARYSQLVRLGILDFGMACVKELSPWYLLLVPT